MQVKKSYKKTRRLILAVLIISWIILGGAIVVYFLRQQDNAGTVHVVKVAGREIKIDETPITEEKKKEYVVPPSYPRYITIPDLNIQKARIVQLGVIAKTGQLEAPVSIHDAGWYTKSSKPGDGSGAVLIDGHNGGPNKGGVFERLGELKNGSEIIVERGDGQIFTYQVVDNRQMLVDEINDPSNPYGMSTMLNSFIQGKEGLNIITCVGDWIKDQNTFNKRVMLRAVKK